MFDEKKQEQNKYTQCPECKRIVQKGSMITIEIPRQQTTWEKLFAIPKKTMKLCEQCKEEYNNQKNNHNGVVKQ